MEYGLLQHIVTSRLSSLFGGMQYLLYVNVPGNKDTIYVLIFSM